jgi:uncharacterized protein YcfJ
MADSTNQALPIIGKDTASNLTNQLTGAQSTFSLLLDEIRTNNKITNGLTLGQLKYEREIAVTDGDKREEQLDEVIAALNEVRSAVTGIKLETNIEPLVNIGENQTKLLVELNKESSLTRKINEGSVEYDKEAAQYRNTSGRDIESKVTGKTSKAGGFIDFETARDTLSGQGKRVREENSFALKSINYTPGKATAKAIATKVGGSRVGVVDASADNDLESSKYQGFFEELKNGLKFLATDGLSEKSGYGIFQKPPTEVVKKDREAKVSSPRQENPETDNVTSTGEIQADVAKIDLELSKQMLDTTKAQLIELKAIREALAPSTPKDLVEQKSAPSATSEKEAEGGGSLIGDLAGAAGNLLGGGKGKAAGKSAGMGGKILGGLGKAAKFLGPAAAVAGAAYSGVEGYKNTGSNFDLKEGEEATTGQKISSTLGGVASGLTFGLLNEKSASQGINKAGEVIGDTASKVGNFYKDTYSNAGAAVMGTASKAGSAVKDFFGFGSKSVPVSPSTAPTPGATVAQTSTENADMTREASSKPVGGGGTIVSNNVSSNNTTKIVPMKASPRPEYTGSSLDRYTSRITVY